MGCFDKPASSFILLTTVLGFLLLLLNYLAFVIHYQ